MNISDLYSPEAYSPRQLDELEGRTSAWEESDGYISWSRACEDERKRWAAKVGFHCCYCQAPVDHVETSNPFLNVMVADKGTNTPHWRKCPKQAWRWSRDD